jgi:hypothetical protein
VGAGKVGMKYVAIQAEIEAKPGAVKFSFETAYSISWALYEELAELSPKLVIEGSICEPMMCFAGDVRIVNAQIHYEDKSAELRRSSPRFLPSKTMSTTPPGKVCGW